jgi:Trypsin-like peptidase domain
MAHWQDRQLIILLLVCLLAPLIARAQPADAPPGENNAYAFRALTVQVRSAKTEEPDIPVEEGYGFVVGRRNDLLTVVTADHVVRDQDGIPYGNVMVELYINRGHLIPAHLLDYRIPHQSGDMAVLEVHKPDVPDFPDSSPVPIARFPIDEGTRAWRIGKEEGWTPSNRPGAFVGRQQTIWLGFDNLDTPRGSSGGPILTDGGLIGMVTHDLSGRAYVLPIDIITEFLARQGVPFDFVNAAKVPRPGGTSLIQGPPVKLLQ